MSEITKDILVGMKNYINLNGWHQSFFYDDSKYDTFLEARDAKAPMCVMGAYAVVASSGREVYKATKAPGYSCSESKLCELFGLDVAEGVAAWNDHPERTKKDILDALDRAVENLDRL